MTQAARNGPSGPMTTQGEKTTEYPDATRVGLQNSKYGPSLKAPPQAPSDFIQGDADWAASASNQRGSWPLEMKTDDLESHAVDKPLISDGGSGPLDNQGPDSGSCPACGGSLSREDTKKFRCRVCDSMIHEAVLEEQETLKALAHREDKVGEIATQLLDTGGIPD